MIIIARSRHTAISFIKVTISTTTPSAEKIFVCCSVIMMIVPLLPNTRQKRLGARAVPRASLHLFIAAHHLDLWALLWKMYTWSPPSRDALRGRCARMIFIFSGVRPFFGAPRESECSTCRLSAQFLCLMRAIFHRPECIFVGRAAADLHIWDWLRARETDGKPLGHCTQ